MLAVAMLLLASAPSQARFLQNDPVGYDDDMDMYTYVQNDPTDKSDPTGLTCTSKTSGNKTVYDCKIDKVAVYESGKIIGWRAPTEAESQSFEQFNARYTAAVNKLAERVAEGDSEKGVKIPNLIAGKGGFTITVGEALDAAVNRRVDFVGGTMANKREFATLGGPGVGADPPVTFVGNAGLHSTESHILHDVGIHGTAAENLGGLQDEKYPLAGIEHQSQYNDAALELLGDN
jgi:hypothetical protein